MTVIVILKAFPSLFIAILCTQSLASLTLSDQTEPQEILDKEQHNDGVRILNSEGTLAFVNNYRKRHSVPPLDYDVVLGQSAAKWAKRVHDQVILLGKMVPIYSHPHIEGENVFVMDTSGCGGNTLTSIQDGRTAIHTWYCESTKYDFAENTFTFNTAHFTQLVWKRTRRFGLAIYSDPVRNFSVVVGRFKPPGNVGFKTSFKENIFPPAKESLPGDEFPSCDSIMDTDCQTNTLPLVSTPTKIPNVVVNGMKSGTETNKSKLDATNANDNIDRNATKVTPSTSRISDSRSITSRDARQDGNVNTNWSNSSLVQKDGNVRKENILQKSNGSENEEHQSLDWNRAGSKLTFITLETKDKEQKSTTSSNESRQSLPQPPTKNRRYGFGDSSTIVVPNDTKIANLSNGEKNVPQVKVLNDASSKVTKNVHETQGGVDGQKITSPTMTE